MVAINNKLVHKVAPPPLNYVCNTEQTKACPQLRLTTVVTNAKNLI